MHTLDHLAGVANRAAIHYTGESQLREVCRARSQSHTNEHAARLQSAAGLKHSFRNRSKKKKKQNNIKAKIP